MGRNFIFLAVDAPKNQEVLEADNSCKEKKESRKKT
jgi:hypothetical protein